MRSTKANVTDPAIGARIHISSPDVGALEESYILDAVRSGWIAPLGPQVDAFEDALAARCERAHAVALSSGTAALHLALLELGCSAGTVVLVPTMTFIATANAVAYTGATPIFVDCDADTGNMDPQLLEEALVVLGHEKRTVAAVVAVDLLGRCADYDRINRICASHYVPLVSDAAESLGSSSQGREAGSFGVAAALSFNGNKILTTSGGGAVLTNDEHFAERIRYLSTQARQAKNYYEHTEIGFNYRMSNILAAVGIAQLERLEEMKSRRRNLRQLYTRVFESVPGIKIFQKNADQWDNCWLTAIVVDSTKTGWSPDVMASFLDERNIESRPLWKPMHSQPVYANSRAFTTGAAETLFRTGLALPSGSSLGGAEIERIDSAMSAFLSQWS